MPVLACYAAGFLPLIWTAFLAVTDGLGADPVLELEYRLGLWALRLLILGLSITPLRQLAGVNLLRFRRAVGLLAFYYVLLHAAAYAILDQSLDWAAIGANILNHLYLTIGFVGLLLLVPLAVTSNRYAIRRLGNRWRGLHKLVYVVAALAAVHFLLSVKSWPMEPVIYAAIVAGLLLCRIRLQRRREKQSSASAAVDERHSGVSSVRPPLPSRRTA
ncbi:protein-methionine-sulfoxide reductase heme-binding subunit MsrQ [Roseomonas sp. E05]|uniref:protein-methionine-sulfoxide reductase heme-binding subunit MsrQ n=1 Tax=Roseomonas sp. E05 TaxID=3046310 RepID=UPI0024BA1628|nr:protein-methionine-sulfoxide reductase heme-binding subunit MsrQ [Roseomonas sp. E05]MDJ0390662.1 protein-methionine-sulfoxide reductase heme-binding subunit MsrQ [Roseomonas sp. E05]